MVNCQFRRKFRTSGSLRTQPYRRDFGVENRCDCNTVQCSPKFTAIIVAKCLVRITNTCSCTVPVPRYWSSAPAHHSCMTCLSCVHSHVIQPWPSSTRIEPKEAKFRTRSNNSKVQGAKMMIELVSVTTYDPDSTAH